MAERWRKAMSAESISKHLDELFTLSSQLEQSAPLQAFLGRLQEALLSMDGKEDGQLSMLLQSMEGEEGIYQEVGKILRKHHDKLKTMTEGLPERLLNFDGDEIQQLTERLLYIVEMTEKAANTTLDLAEKTEDRLHEQLAEQKKMLEDLRSLHDNGGLSPDQQSLLARNITLIQEQQSATEAQITDLGEIMIAQNYQDLSGQIIHKTLELIQGLEQDLAHLIERYGSGQKTNATTEVATTGPLPESNGARQDQVDVDQLLADYGF